MRNLDLPKQTCAHWDESSIALSNNGKILACVIPMDKGIYQLVIFDLNSCKQRVLVVKNRMMLFPSWSPDDSRLALYLAGEGAAGKPGMFSLVTFNITAEHGQVEEIVPPLYGSISSSMIGGRQIPPRWSPDGKRIIFEGTIKGNDRKSESISIVNLDGKKLSKFRWGKWSPDGKRLFSTIWEDSSTGGFNRLVAVDVASGSITKLEGKLKPKNLEKWEYSLEGTMVAIVTSDRKLNIINVNSGLTSENPGVQCNSSSALYWIWVSQIRVAPQESKKREPENIKHEQKQKPDGDNNVSLLRYAGLTVALAGIVILLLLRRKK